eukprot:15464419-Alexandrium_andersonii.AAC.1
MAHDRRGRGDPGHRLGAHRGVDLPPARPGVIQLDGHRGDRRARAGLLLGLALCREGPPWRAGGPELRAERLHLDRPVAGH